MPFTADGMERVVALDLLSHYVVLMGMVNHGLLKPGAHVMNSYNRFNTKLSLSRQQKCTAATDRVHE